MKLGAVVPLLAGLEHEQHPAGQVGCSGGEQPGRAHEHRGVRVVAARVHRVVDPWSSKSRPVSSGIGSASMSPRSSTVGPGLPPVSIAAMPLVSRAA
jgi:hypothetical protein